MNASAPAGMVFIPGGTFLMGSDRHYPDEAPARPVTTGPFRIDATPVTNAMFRAFVAATGHVTVAEKSPRAADYPDADPDLLHPGSLTFHPPSGPVDLRQPRLWWAFTRDACWHRPEGPGSTLDGRDDHPVVHVAHADALAWARWAGRDLPTEAELERAARGGIEGAEFAWGAEFAPGGRHMANTWQGAFPHRNLCDDGFAGTSPVRTFPANGYGVFDLIGNAWEWTADRYRPRRGPAAQTCCAPAGLPGSMPVMVIKGGSHLCAPNWCQRYRPAARQPEPADTSTAHLGFRCVLRGDPATGPAR